MPLKLVNADITELQVDAVVNSTNMDMYGYSGVDRIIHTLGGEEFERECLAIRGRCFPGGAVYTNAYNMNCKYIIHTICLGWLDGSLGEMAIISSCYRKSLEVAIALGCQSVAIPLIGAGSMGTPIPLCLNVAVTAIKEYLELYEDIDVSLVLYGSVVNEIAKIMFGDLDKAIAKTSKTEHDETLDNLLSQKKETFVDMLFRFMNERNIDKPSQLYKKAFVSKATYSRLISGDSSKPSLRTAVGLVMALELTIEEAEEFLASAGIALSDASTFDTIVRYFIEHKNYDVWELDVQLIKYNCPTIMGCE